MFDTITGLPVHPLVVHAAVVLWPLGVLGLIALVLAPRLKRSFGWLTMACLLVGAIAVYVSKESGEKLGHRIGTPHEHAEKADVLTALAFFTLLLSLVWWFLDRRAHKATGDTTPDRTVGATRGSDRTAVTAGATDRTSDHTTDGTAHGAHPVTAARPSMLARLLGIAASLLGLVSLVFTVLVGHTGATAAWGERMTAAQTAPTATATPAASAATTKITADQIKAHNTKTSCWVAIGGKAYDLTKWISQHPGGPDKISALCGTDASTAFTNEHGDDGPNGKPQQALAQFLIGTVSR